MELKYIALMIFVMGMATYLFAIYWNRYQDKKHNKHH